VVIAIGPDGQPVIPADTAPDLGNLYHSDDLPAAGGDEPVEVHGGPTPELHVVKRGDTLWDICWYYFNDPWQWPKVWSYNPQVSNPHWIYPGDLVRLLPQGMIAATLPPPTDDVEPDTERSYAPPPARRLEVSLRDVAFLERDDLERSIILEGSTDAKELLSDGDAVYLRYQEGAPPKVGQRYGIYEADQPVVHPRTGKRLGSYVRVLGELEITSVKKDKRARATILRASQEIGRGALVGPLITRLRTVPPVPNEVDLQGTVVDILGADEIIGPGAVVFIDLGASSGLKVGNRLSIIRRGDALIEEAGPVDLVGQDDRRYPARALGEIVVVEVGDAVSIGLVTLAVEEMGAGDLVLMQASP
jgi:hypothetical protein